MKIKFRYLEIQFESDDGSFDIFEFLGVRVLLAVATVQKPGQSPDPRAHDPDEVVKRTEEVAPDQDEAGHVDVEEEPGISEK